MAKSTMGTRLPRKLEEKMKIVGEQIKLARLRRNLSVAQVAERATCSPLTVARIEKALRLWPSASTCVSCMLFSLKTTFFLLPSRTHSADSCRILL